ncbi:MAG: ABC transporter ATP-binding protein [bacterium]
MSGARLLLEAVRVRRGRGTILDVDRLAVAAGEFVAVVGRNGAGKTTLLNVCCGLAGPGGGRVELDGRPLSPRLRQQIGYLPQAAEYNAGLPLTVREVVRLGRAARRGLLRRFRRLDDQRTAEWLDRLGLGPLGGRTFRTLSGGEQQKALLARAMVQEPALLLLDEPGAYLDVDWRRRLTDTIEAIYLETGLTVLMVSHEVGLVPACCTRVVLMKAGRVVTSGPPDEALSPERLSALYGCRIEVREQAGRRHVVSLPNGSEGG